MTFVSYAQNFEDVMLFRALGHIENGFYVDVGAYSPDEDSVTKTFYQRGWSGLNIEPNPKKLLELIEARVRDINLGVAVSDFAGDVELYVVSDTGLTTIDPEVAKRYESSQWQTSVVTVEARTLSSILIDHVLPSQPIHFLKIDVEGHELAAIRGTDLRSYRPWIIIVEATTPMSQDTTHVGWEDRIVSSGYSFVYWDGLNRYYVADEHQHLKSAFNSPPNVFDQFITSKEQSAIEWAEKARDLLSDYDLREAESKTLLAQTEDALLNCCEKLDYLKHRALWEKLLFAPTGKPKKALRRILFHKSGKPRGVFKRLILHKNQSPHKPFRLWIACEEYQSLPRAVKLVKVDRQTRGTTLLSPLSPRAMYFADRLGLYLTKAKGK